MIEAEPSFGYRTVAALLGMNKSTVQRIFQLKGWQVRKRPLGQRPRIEAKASRAEAPDQRWATDLRRVWGGKDGCLSLALVIDFGTRQLLGWHLSRTGGQHRVGRAGAGVDYPLRHVGAGASAFPAALGQRAGVHQTRLHAPRAQLRPAAGVHHPALPTAERDGGTVIRTLKEQCVHPMKARSG
ncbi:hypothetical protein [Stenotrophomonas sp. GZD-301]|uniref:hypothetical protein n=1 Tax=Stenotrophomonas sp. GZD-301 TaxID=3404814 RepID=UPI003BB70592